MRRSRFAVCIALIVLAVLGTLTAHQGIAAEDTFQPGSTHKVLAAPGVLDPTAPGVRLLHDYGTFALYSVAAPSLDTVLGSETSGSVLLADEMDTLLFDGSPIHTLAAPQPVAPMHGPALHLVQFVGPIKAEWLERVEATGASLVHYIANNGYLVWADETARARLDALAASSDFLQWSAAYPASVKFGPTLRDDVARQRDAKPDAESDERVRVTVQMVLHPGQAETEKRIEALSTRVLSAWSPILRFQNATIEVRALDLAALAALPDVYWIGEYDEPELMDEVQGQILAGTFNEEQSGPAAPGYKAWLDSYGFSQNPADYPIIDITDDGVGDGTLPSGDSTLHAAGDPNSASRVAFILNCTDEAGGGSVGGHGHLNASIAVGYDTRAGAPYRDENGYGRGLGINPYGRVGGTRIFDTNSQNPFDLSACGGTLQSLITRSYNAGARISSNSWGRRSGAPTYNYESQAYDVGTRDADPAAPGNQEFITVFAAGNYGSGAGTVTSPGNGKNMITVGASENFRPTDSNSCSTGAVAANNAMDIASFSGRGPSPGERAKPELVGPGTIILGTASTHPAYNAGAICGRVTYYPPGQTVFTASSGTSHSTPAVSGIASLYYWWLENRYSLATPSPAMMKAYLLAHPTYLTGNSANDTLPSPDQGYGMPDMTAGLDDSERFLLDQSVRFDDAGDLWTFEGTVADPSRPVRIVLAYTDAAGALGTSPQVNDLSLSAEISATTFFGNHFDGQWSTPGGAPDTKNNYEAIFLPAGAKGALNISVTAFGVAGDGVPGVGDGTDQDFALVCYNCRQNSDFALAATPRTQAVCVPDDAAYTLNVDAVQGFSAPVSLSAQGNPSGTVATFSQNPVTPPGTSSLAVSVGALAPAGHYRVDVVGIAPTSTHTMTLGLDLFTQAAGRPTLLDPTNSVMELPVMPLFSWGASAQAATYTIEIATDPGFMNIVRSASGLGGTSFTSAVPLEPRTAYWWRVRAANACGESMDSLTFSFNTVTPADACVIGDEPQLHFADRFEAGAPGWSHSGTNDSWTLTATQGYGGTQGWRAQAVPAVSDQRLVSPPIALPTNRERLTLQFWNRQSLEDRSPQGCFDGALLEISTDGGATFAPIMDGLLTDPYDGPVSGAHGNPLGGLSAWCGDPQEWLKSVVALDGYAGQTVQFRFRVGTDSATGRAPDGWAIDEVAVQSCTVDAAPTPTVLPTQTATPTQTGTPTPVSSPSATSTRKPTTTPDTPFAPKIYLPLIQR